MLARPPAEVSLLEVAEAVEGKQLAASLLDRTRQLRSGTSLSRRMTSGRHERAKIEQELRRVRLIDVAAFARDRPGRCQCVRV